METSNPQPGQTVTPTSQAAADNPQPPTEPPEPPEPQTPAESQSTSVSESAPPEPAAIKPPTETQVVEEAKELDDSFESAQPEDADNEDQAGAITWTASEFIAHAKSLGWYATLAAAAIALAAIFFLITRDPVSVGVVIVSAILLGTYGRHQPRQLEYRVDNNGLNVGQKRFGYDEFRSFSIIPEGAFSSIVFMPLKRFAVPTTIYFPPEDENKIASLIANHLPLEERGHDAIDRLMQRIRF